MFVPSTFPTQSLPLGPGFICPWSPLSSSKGAELLLRLTKGHIPAAISYPWEPGYLWNWAGLRPEGEGILPAQGFLSFHMHQNHMEGSLSTDS